MPGQGWRKWRGGGRGGEGRCCPCLPFLFSCTCLLCFSFVARGGMPRAELLSLLNWRLKVSAVRCGWPVPADFFFFFCVCRTGSFL